MVSRVSFVTDCMTVGAWHYIFMQFSVTILRTIRCGIMRFVTLQYDKMRFPKSCLSQKTVEPFKKSTRFQRCRPRLRPESIVIRENLALRVHFIHNRSTIDVIMKPNVGIYSKNNFKSTTINFKYFYGSLFQVTEIYFLK